MPRKPKNAPAKPKVKAAEPRRQVMALQARGGLAKRIEEATLPVAREEFTAIKRPAFAAFEAFVAEDNSTAEINVYDVIGTWELNARTFREALKQITASNITLRINSPGGSVFDAFAMYEDLRQHKARIRVEIVGLAASAASLLAMAGDEIVIADNGFLMIHNAWTLAMGDTREMSKTARVLSQIDKRLASTYADRTGNKAGEVAEWMDAETWLDSEDAVAMGFADARSSAVPVENLAHDVSAFSKTPGVLVKASKAAPAAAPAKPTAATPAAPAEDWSAVLAAINRLSATLSQR